MRQIRVWLGWSTAVVTGFVLLAVASLLVVLDRGLSDFGITPREAYRVWRAELAQAAAIRNAEGSIDTPRGMAERGFVRIGGIEQWVTIRGEDRENPAILIFHGGPGDTNRH